MIKRDEKGYAKEIHIIWSAADVIETAREMGMKLSAQQISNVLEILEHKHDAQLGISWDTIRATIESELKGG